MAGKAATCETASNRDPLPKQDNALITDAEFEQRAVPIRFDRKPRKTLHFPSSVNAFALIYGGVPIGCRNTDTVSRVWRKVKGDWDVWNARSLAAEPIVHLILDGTVVRVRLDRKATAIALLVVLGVREDGQKVLLTAKNMGSAPFSTISSSAGCASQSS